MKKGIFPIYREVDQNAAGFTLLLDNQSQRVYKVNHGGRNDYKFWIAWALLLVFLRMVKSLHLTITSPLTILIVIVLFAISAGLGVYKYNKSHQGGREVFYTQETMAEYIEKGKETLKGDIILAVIEFVVFCVFMILFLIYQWFTWLFFAMFLFYMFILQICHLTPERLQLYRGRY